MTSGIVKFVIFLISLAIGYGLSQFWHNLRPADDFNIVLAVGVVGFAASFISMYYMTQSS